MASDERALEEAPRTEGAAVASAGVEFETLYALYFGFTWRVLGHLGVPTRSMDDAVQEVWVVVHRRLVEFEGRSALKTWLFGIALNVSRNLRRSELRRLRDVELAPEPVSLHPDPELVRAGNEALERVERFLDTLDEQRRAIFVCNLLEHLSAQETAEATGCDVATVYQRVRSLRHAFKTWLDADAAAEEAKLT
ncbi:MAG TPA: sigma-70 family RNA polymerase sigma factor [Polyangiaceae bacterium]|nr:sigma-70 family RNA polymerase sigma factor [Polyangiaceae bacterium]